MKRILIIYKSEHGATKQYAEWLSEAFPSATLSNIDVFNDNINDYDVILIGSCTYGGKMPAVEYLVANWKVLLCKHVIFFAVGAVPPESPYSKESYESIPQEIREKIKYCKLPGRISETKPNFIEKLAFKMFLKGNPDIAINKAKLAPIVEYVKNLAI